MVLFNSGNERIKRDYFELRIPAKWTGDWR